MIIHEGWVLRTHIPNDLGTYDTHLHGPSLNKEQVLGMFFENGNFFPTRREAVRMMKVAPGLLSSPAYPVTADVQYARLIVAEHPDEWIAPFTKGHSYVVLWFYDDIFERMSGTAVDEKGEELPGIIRYGYIPGADFTSNGNRPFPEFELAAHCAYEAGRQGRAYCKIAAWSMTIRPPRKKKVLSGAS